MFIIKLICPINTVFNSKNLSLFYNILSTPMLVTLFTFLHEDQKRKFVQKDILGKCVN